MKPSERLEKYGWIKGVYKSEAGRRCMLGAMVEDPYEIRRKQSMVEEAREAYGIAPVTMLEDLARARYKALPDRNYYEVWSGTAFIGLYNDDVDTTEEDVLSLLKECGL